MGDPSTSNATSLSDDNHPGAGAADSLVKTVFSPVSLEAFVENSKASLFFRYTWGPSLITIPVCLEMLGACHAVASTEFARKTKVQRPENRFQYLSNNHIYLTTQLVHVRNEALLAFEDARLRMGIIKVASEVADDMVKELAVIFENKTLSAQHGNLLRKKLGVLQRQADNCKSNAMEMHKKFTHWLNFVMELHEACQETSGHSEASFRTFESRQKADELLEEHQKQQVADAKAAREKFEGQLKTQQEQYEKFMKKFPKGGDLIMYEWIQAGGFVIRMGATAAAIYKSPTTAPELLPKLGKEFLDILSQGSGSSKGTDGKIQAPTEGSTLDDLLLANCDGIKSAIESLENILKSGPQTDGVNWDLVNVFGDDPETPGGQGHGPSSRAPDVEVVSFLLEYYKSLFPEPAKDNENLNIKTLAEALDEAIKVVGELEEEAKLASSSKKWVKPAKDSSKVLGWVGATEKILTKVRGLSSSLKSCPGLQIGGQAPTAGVQPPKEKRPTLGSSSKVLLDAATAEAEIIRRGLETTQLCYEKATERQFSLQARLDRLRLDLQRVKDEIKNLDGVRDMIRKCIAFAIDLKEKVLELVKFFSGLSELVDSAVNKALTPYLKTYELAVRGSESSKHLSKSHLELLFQYTITIAANFSLFQDTSAMYTEIHDTYILEGMTVVNGMGAGGELAPGIDQKVQELKRYSVKAQQGISDVVQKKSVAIISSLASHIKDAKEAQALLPPLSEEDVTSIKSGIDSLKTQLSLEVAQQNIVLNYLDLSEQQRKEEAKLLVRESTAKIYSSKSQIEN
ncbi:hypothetical protein TWF481_006704 [Arthrobotrys musiformis]|uniref:Uncharacterized protein n=1 Tax=Arthrobotrys musiformis TaxID=47236 RepID=A0AAV9W9A1_9PEZI